MRIFFILIFLFICLESPKAQNPASPVTLTIVGRHNYQPPAIGYLVELHFIDDPSRCDPVKGYVPIAEQIKHYSESLASSGLGDYTFTQVEKLSEPPYVNKRYRLVVADIEAIEKVVLLAASAGIEISEIRSVYRKHSFKEQDPHAVLALEDAVNKAGVLAQHLNMEVDYIINIDDDTRIASIYDKTKPVDIQPTSEVAAILAELEEKFMQFGGSYTLRVTFALK